MLAPPPPKKNDSTSKSLHAHIASWNLQVHMQQLITMYINLIKEEYLSLENVSRTG